MIQFIIQFKNFKKIQFKKIFNSKICKKIQFKKIFNSKICNSKKYSIQKFAKKFNSKFDSKFWIWQDSIQQYIHSITKHGYRSPLPSCHPIYISWKTIVCFKSRCLDVDQMISTLLKPNSHTQAMEKGGAALIWFFQKEIRKWSIWKSGFMSKMISDD